MTDIDFENVREMIINGSVDEWSVVVGDLGIMSEDIVYMFMNPGMFSENDRYDLLDNFRKICGLIAEDTRSTGTILKNLKLNE